MTDLLDRILELDKAATAGPWVACPLDRNHTAWVRSSDVAIGKIEFTHASALAADLDAIATYRTAAPALARALKIAVEALTELEDGVPGAFSRDRLKHASNCINAAILKASLAKTAIAKELEGVKG